jgi:hypothetical protein
MLDAMVISIDRSSDETAITKVRQALSEGDSASVSASEMAWRTKLPIESCRAALFELCARHPSRMQAGGDHGLLFSFEDLAATRAALRPTQRFERALSIFLVLLGPELLLMLSLQIAALISFASRGSGIAVLLIAVPLAFALFVLGFLTIAMTQLLALLGLSLILLGVTVTWVPLIDTGAPLSDHAWTVLFLGGLSWFFLLVPGTRLIKRAFAAGKKLISDGTIDWIWRSLYSMVRGPIPPSAAIEHDRVLALIAKKGGSFRDEDLVELEGWTKERAGSKAAHLVLAHGGQLEVDGAQLIYQVKVTAPDEQIDTRPAAARKIAPRLFGCSVAFAAFVISSLALALAGLWLDPELRVLPLRITRPEEGLGAWLYLPFLAGVPLRIIYWLIQRKS